MEFGSEIKVRGDVQMIIQHDDGREEVIEFPNTILVTGRNALASSLANSFNQTYEFYINRMLFGTGGTDGGGNKKVVSPNRNGLYSQLVSKSVISAVDPNVPSQVVFTSVLPANDVATNNQVLNEMALQMATGDLYSMVTFPNLTKTASMQIVFNWRLSFI